MAYRVIRLLALFGGALGQRSASTPICDYYADKILSNNTAAGQQLLITLLINTVVLGNYTTPNVGIPVHGIAAPTVYNGVQVNLLPFFTGDLNSTNEGGDVGVSKLFLDDGAAGALAKNTSSNGNTTSAQFELLTHIYQYFGTMLGCSKQGVPDFPAYLGRPSMYDVHKFMDLDINQIDFFIDQCQKSALSLGFSKSDSDLFAIMLQKFNTRCSAPFGAPGIASGAPKLQSCCVAPSCPLGNNATCSLYANDGVAIFPANATSTTTATGNATTNGTVSSTNSATAKPSSSTGYRLGTQVVGLNTVIAWSMFTATGIWAIR